MQTVQEQTRFLRSKVNANPGCIVGFFGRVHLEAIAQLRAEGVMVKQYNAGEINPALMGTTLYAFSTEKMPVGNKIPTLDISLYGDMG